jgi:hypothetical protein
MKFKVTVCRVAYAFNTVDVEADSAEEAKNIAVDEAGNHTYSEKNVEYEAHDVVEVDFVDRATRNIKRDQFLYVLAWMFLKMIGLSPVQSICKDYEYDADLHEYVSKNLGEFFERWDPILDPSGYSVSKAVVTEYAEKYNLTIKA